MSNVQLSSEAGDLVVETDAGDRRSIRGRSADSISRSSKIIRHVFESSGMTQEAFARKIGISQASLSNILSGKTGPRHTTVARVTQAFGLDPAIWFLEEDEELARDWTARQVPVVGKVSAGGTKILFSSDGAFVGNPLSWVPRPPGVSQRKIAALQVDGESMEPAYPDGSYIYFEPNLPYHKGHKVVLITRKGYVYFKLWDEDGEMAILHSLNPDQPDILIPRRDVLEVRRVRFSREEA